MYFIVSGGSGVVGLGIGAGLRKERDTATVGILGSEVHQAVDVVCLPIMVGCELTSTLNHPTCETERPRQGKREMVRTRVGSPSHVRAANLVLKSKGLQC